jgi:hypothetical protein
MERTNAVLYRSGNPDLAALCVVLDRIVDGVEMAAASRRSVGANLRVGTIDSRADVTGSKSISARRNMITIIFDLDGSWSRLPLPDASASMSLTKFQMTRVCARWCGEIHDRSLIAYATGEQGFA